MPDKINPYNFVPLSSAPSRKPWSDLTTHERLPQSSYAGHLILRFRTLTPVFIPSRIPEDVEQVLCQCSDDCRKNRKKKVTFLRFHHINNVPTIPASSIKGMVRSIFEVLTDSCMVLYAGTYGNSTYPVSSDWEDPCNKANGLCPACSVFGTIQGEDLLLQGKVRFSDAVGRVEDVESGVWKLKELSSPKPERHPAFYAKDGRAPSSGPRGRKFYYHHNPNNLNFTQDAHNHRNALIKQRIKAHANLQATMDFQGLSESELAALLYALELDLAIKEKDGGKVVIRQLGHKIGMGKPLGLGSLGIIVAGGRIDKGSERYQIWESAKPAPLRTTVDGFKQNAPPPSRFLEDLLDLKKHSQGSIEYPDKRGWFDQNQGISFDERGFF